MKKFFLASLKCSSGILGGGIWVDPEKLTWRTGKLTVPPDSEIWNFGFPA